MFTTDITPQQKSSNFSTFNEPKLTYQTSNERYLNTLQKISKIVILILQIKKKEHNKVHQKMSTIQIYLKMKFKCEETNLF